MLLKKLIGTWDLYREIHTPTGLSHLQGSCRFTILDDFRLLCHEQGQLNHQGIISDVERSYIYEQHQVSNIIILYDDPHRKGDILHELSFQIDNLQNEIARHCHRCGLDAYDVEFTFSSSGTITIVYDVKGPSKNYVMRSTLVRQ